MTRRTMSRAVTCLAFPASPHNLQDVALPSSHAPDVYLRVLQGLRVRGRRVGDDLPTCAADRGRPRSRSPPGCPAPAPGLRSRRCCTGSQAVEAKFEERLRAAYPG